MRKRSGAPRVVAVMLIVEVGGGRWESPILVSQTGAAWEGCG